MEVLMKILNQGTEFDTLAETATRDRYEQLANLMATMGEKGELLLAVALANVVPSNEQDDLAQVLVTLFDAVSLLYQFLWNILSQEVKFGTVYTALAVMLCICQRCNLTLARLPGASEYRDGQVIFLSCLSDLASSFAKKAGHL